MWENPREDTMKKNMAWPLFMCILTVQCQTDKSPTKVSLKDNNSQQQLLIRRFWTQSSMPVNQGVLARRYSPYLSSRGRLNWYNPYRQIPRQMIWPDAKVNPQQSQVLNTLCMEFQPQQEDSAGSAFSWAGVTCAVPEQWSRLDQNGFLSLWVKGDQGSLHIDLGVISEDVIPNQILDSEDNSQDGLGNGILDPGEDVGLDGMAGTDPSDFWDINGNGVQDKNEPTSWDDWKYTPAADNSNPDYTWINGTENSANDYGGRKPDSEDINENGVLDVQNNYFEYVFSLEKSGPDTSFITDGRNNPNGWRLYQLPLHSPAVKVGEPDYDQIKFVRIWIDHFTTPGQIQFYFETLYDCY
jgi:hypothetical protein